MGGGVNNAAFCYLSPELKMLKNGARLYFTIAILNSLRKEERQNESDCN